MKKTILLLIPLLSLISMPSLFAGEKVKTGDEVLVQKYLSLIKGKTIGLITNQSGRLSDGRDVIDVLDKIPGVKLVALFSPEHGIRGQASAGEKVTSNVDEKTGVPIYSLYGKTNKPTPEMLKGIDVLLYDIQDVGTRFYTFISTLDLSLEAAAENHIEFIVLDRPDMMRANLVDGPLLLDSLRSFIGIQPITSVYGMTPGEFATMINDAHMLKDGVKADLKVVKMENYRRSMWYDQTGLKWVTPSPNLPDMNAVEVYGGNVLFEATNVSEGRGTEHPFETIGAPFINSRQLVDLLNEQHVPGVRYEPVDFTPRSFPWAVKPKYEGEVCHGVKIIVAERNVFKPVEAGVTLVWAIHKLYPDSFKMHGRGFDLRAGTPEVRTMIDKGKTPREIISAWQPGLRKFEKFREKYLLYK